ncbi:MAG: MBG domain-containing protein, partial [Paludibacter sp.]
GIGIGVPGTYPIVVWGGIATNYMLYYTNAIYNITKAPLLISVKNDSINKGVTIPNFTLVYSGFKGTDNATNLDELPTVSCLATTASPIGSYDIVLSAGSDKNYSYSLTNGLLIIKNNTGLNEVNSFYTSLYPVPTSNRVFIKSDITITRVEVYSIDGRLMLLNTSNDIKSIDLSGLMEGSYLFKLHSKTGISTKMVIKN